ncbi:RHS repeat-associated core domain-containing protein [Bacillus sp. FSL R9-9530]|uniref:RHS repeat-associated core domain-containing protein n=1 Tax=Bacillus mycoides TaxID=1405 RepID=UPI002E0E3143
MTNTLKSRGFVYNKDNGIIKEIDNEGREATIAYKAANTEVSETNQAADNPFGYAGYMYDKEIGMYYLIARYYNPEHGVFLSVDPDPGDEDDPITMNGYTYADNNPVMMVDPDGHWAWMAAGAAFGGVSSYYSAKKSGARGWKLAGAVAGGAALGAIGGVGGGSYRALNVARKAYNKMPGLPFKKGQAAHKAWGKAMKNVVPGGKYEKQIRGDRSTKATKKMIFNNKKRR